MAIEWKREGWGDESATIGAFKLRVGQANWLGEDEHYVYACGHELPVTLSSMDEAKLAAVEYARELLSAALAELPAAQPGEGERGRG